MAYFTWALCAKMLHSNFFELLSQTYHFRLNCLTIWNVLHFCRQMKTWRWRKKLTFKSVTYYMNGTLSFCSPSTDWHTKSKVRLKRSLCPFSPKLWNWIVGQLLFIWLICFWTNDIVLVISGSKTKHLISICTWVHNWLKNLPRIDWNFAVSNFEERWNIPLLRPFNLFSSTISMQKKINANKNKKSMLFKNAI